MFASVFSEMTGRVSLQRASVREKLSHTHRSLSGLRVQPPFNSEGLTENANRLYLLVTLSTHGSPTYSEYLTDKSSDDEHVFH